MPPIDGPTPHRPPYWLLAVFGVLLLSPPVWATVALVGAAVGLTVFAAARRAAQRRTVEGELARDQAAGATVLGTAESGRPVAVRDDQLSAHGLILGASGSGKTTTLLAILTDHIRRGRPVVAIDMKGSPAFAEEMEAAARAAGRPFRLWTLDGPTHWNPLQYGNATELKDKLIATERFTEPHYQRAAERYLQAALQVLHAIDPDTPPTIAQVVDAMDPRRLAGLARGLPPARSARLQEYLATLTPDQLSAVRGLGTRLAIISESHIGPYLAPPGPPLATGTPGVTVTGGETVDLRRAIDGEEVVVFSFNSSTYGALAAQVGALAVQDLISAVGDRYARNGGPSHGGAQAMLAIDEFSALRSDNVLSLIARAREAGAGLLLCMQETADLERAAPGLSDQVIGSTAFKIVHRQDVPASALKVAQIVGTVRRWEETINFGRPWGARSSAARGSRRLVEQFRIHPNEIKTLRTGEAVMITKTPHASVKKIRVRPPSPNRGAGRSGAELG